MQRRQVVIAAAASAAATVLVITNAAWVIGLLDDDGLPRRVDIGVIDPATADGSTTTVPTVAGVTITAPEATSESGPARGHRHHGGQAVGDGHAAVHHRDGHEAHDDGHVVRGVTEFDRYVGDDGHVVVVFIFFLVDFVVVLHVDHSR